MSNDANNTPLMTPSRKIGRWQFCMLLVVSFLMPATPLVVHQARTWTDTGDGFRNGIFSALILVFPAWLLLLFPFHFLAYFLCQRRGWNRYFLWGTMLLPLFFFVSTIQTSCDGSLPPKAHFEALTKKTFPQSAHEIKVHFRGGLLADREDIFYFRCSAEDTDALIRALGLRVVERKIDDYGTSFFRKESDWPDPKTWNGFQYYEGDSGHSDNNDSDDQMPFRFYQFLTDDSRTQIYLGIYNI